MAKEKNWRQKVSLIEKFPSLAQQLGENLFNTRLNQMCIGWLKDPVYAVREAALNNLKQLTLFFGEKWMASQVFSSVAALTAEEVYLHRLTPLFAISCLAELASPDVIRKNFLPVLTKMQNDPVPNVRMNVAKTIAVLTPRVSAHKDMCESLQRILEKLNKDSEFDVKHFAGVSLLKLKGV